MWQVTEQDLESIAIGAGILGTGGGGNPYIGMLRARQAIRENGPVNVLSPGELGNDDQVICVGGIGAPTVGIEKMRDKQAYYALRAIEEYTGTRATSLVSNEIGGSNSLEPIIPAAMSGLPVVDADGMGRAYPEFQMKTYFVYGVPYVPMAVSDEKGNTAIIPEAISAKWVERMARAPHYPDGLRGLLRHCADDCRTDTHHRRARFPDLDQEAGRRGEEGAPPA